MLEHLQAVPPDPILGVLAAYNQDPNPNKIDLGVGVYKDEEGRTPILPSVLSAERELLERQTSKSYLGPTGVTGFNEAISRLIFGADSPALNESRIRTVQTPGGTGALRVAAEVIRTANPDARVWFSDPTWANHTAIFPAGGLQSGTYPYFDPDSNGLRFDAMMEALGQLGPNDAVLLHACCHNPCGVSPDESQWREIAELAGQRGFLPVIDMAYQGFERGLDDDNLAIRVFAEQCPELIVASSCSKNFAMYRDRVGAISVLASSAQKAADIETVIHSLTRKNYSMPPAHGPAVIDIILHDDALTAQWRAEVGDMRDRINGLRAGLVARIAASGVERDFSFLERQAGMFSFLGLTVDQVQKLREQFSIYTVNSARINIASLNQANLDYFVSGLKSVLEG
ncbi:amino acid aminotransferase [Elongatibacter sediminis]|uniref:Aminotransferase n=1 Tax=Elongatibacter sediminis TaxID=3119006 RepID=A0AAW9RNV2_9GAMM